MDEPKLNEIAKCHGCGMNLKFDGAEWKHTGVHFRHPAEPVRNPQPRLDTILQPPQCQVEADGDMLWA